MLSLVNVRTHGDNAANTSRVGLARTSTGSVHDTVLGVTQEVGRATETVQHAGAHDAGAVRVGVHVNLNGGVHANAAETADDLGRVGDLLRAQEESGGIALVVLEEALEAFRRETDGGGGGEVKVAAVEQVQEGVLQNLGPDLEVAEVGTAAAQTTNDGVGNVTNTGLEGEEVLGETAVLDLVLQELDQVAGNVARALVLGGAGRGDVGSLGLNDGNDLLGVDGDVRETNTVLRVQERVGLAVGRVLGDRDIVETFEGGVGGVKLDDDLVGHLDEFGRSTNGSTGDDTTLLGDGGSLNDGDIELVAGLVLGVPALNKFV